MVFFFIEIDRNFALMDRIPDRTEFVDHHGEPGLVPPTSDHRRERQHRRPLKYRRVSLFFSLSISLSFFLFLFLSFFLSHSCSLSLSMSMKRNSFRGHEIQLEVHRSFTDVLLPFLDFECFLIVFFRISMSFTGFLLGSTRFYRVLPNFYRILPN